MTPYRLSRRQRIYNAAKRSVLLVLPFVNTVRVVAFLRDEARRYGVPSSSEWTRGYVAALEEVAHLLNVKL